MIETIQALDISFFKLVNGFAGTNEHLDRITLFIANNYLIKGIPFWMLWWSFWFSRDSDRVQVRAKLLAMMAISIVAILVGRLLSAVLPYRLRPMHDPAVESILPINIDPLTLNQWSSMPSDTSVLFFSFATSIFLLNRRLGALMMVYTALFICLPRVYAGFHFPSDIIVGTAIGILISLTLMKPLSRLVLRLRLLTLEDHYPALFYPLVFLISLESATMFDSARAFVAEAYKFAKFVMI